MPPLPEMPLTQGPLDLARLSLPGPLTIAVLAPHPDDFDAIGVTLRHFHLRGDSIHLAVLTTGASGVEDGYAGATTDAQKAALREGEQTASCAFFGLPLDRLTFLRLPPDRHGHPALDDANRARMRDYLAVRVPDLVFMPHGNDSNVTHQRTYALFRAVALAERWALWACLNQDAKTASIRTDLYMPFDREMAEWKAELLRLHRSQQQRNLNTRGTGFDARVLAVNRKGGETVRAPYAEIFELERYGEAVACPQQGKNGP